MKAKNIEEFLGTMLESVTQMHKDHLKTSKYSAHKALNEFYDEATDAVDSIIECYQGIYGKVNINGNAIESNGDSIKYLEDLKAFVKDSRGDLIKEEDTELWSEIDNFLSLIDSTLYKLKELKENMNTENSLYESMGNLKSLTMYLEEKACKEDGVCPKCGKKHGKDEDCDDIPINEEDVKDEKTFREYAMAILKKMHGDDFDEEKAKETIDGMLADKKDDEDWGVLIGKLQKC